MEKFASILFKASMVLMVVLWTAIAAVAGGLVWRYGYEIDIPNARRLVSVSPETSACPADGERTFVGLGSVPPVVRHALLGAEEPDFFDREPIDPARDVIRGLLSGSEVSPRASMISMGVTRCLMSLSQRCCQKMIDWHIAHFILLVRVEQTLSKDAIFERFINESWFGRSARGVVAAAAVYFGKPLSELTIAEAAYLAGLLKAPNHFSRNSERGMERRNFVVDRMLAAGTISIEQAAAAKQEPLRLREGPAPI